MAWWMWAVLVADFVLVVLAFALVWGGVRPEDPKP